MRPTEAMLARKYARAYAAVYGKQWDISSYERLQACIIALQERQKIMRAYLSVPCVQSVRFCPALLRVVGRYHLDGLLAPLLQLLARDRRLALCIGVLRALCIWYDEEHNIQHVEIRTAVPLRIEQRDALIDAITQRVGSARVYVHAIHDTNVIAGVMCVGRDFIWEDSIRKRLRALTTVCQGINRWK